MTTPRTQEQSQEISIALSALFAAVEMGDPMLIETAVNSLEVMEHVQRLNSQRTGGSREWKATDTRRHC